MAHLVPVHVRDERVHVLRRRRAVVDRVRVLVHVQHQERRAERERLRVVARRRLGSTVSSVVLGRLDEHQRSEALRAGLELEPIGMQDLFVHLTSEVLA